MPPADDAKDISRIAALQAYGPLLPYCAVFTVLYGFGMAQGRSCEMRGVMQSARAGPRIMRGHLLMAR
jgi:hypothetical protein